MTLLQLDGPRLQPQRGAPDSLVVLVHGFGSSGDDLIGLAEAWQQALPTTYFVAPDGPESVPGMPAHMPGYQWFDLGGSREALPGKVAASAKALDKFIDAELARLNLGPERLALVGFSQGTMLSLHVGLRRAVAPAAIIGYSGMLADDPATLAQEVTAKPPVLLIHGEEDDRIPAAAAMQGALALGTVDVPARWMMCPGLGHSIDESGLLQGGRFLLQALSGRL